MSESPFLDEMARDVVLRSGTPGRKKVLEEALKRLTEMNGEKGTEESQPECV